jgi:putative tricarboxylic transport membrane protein
MLWVLGGLVAQMLTMKTIGFSLSTGLLFAATARAFGKGALWKTFPAGVVFALLVWLMFAKGLQLTLPAGPLERLF